MFQHTLQLLAEHGQEDSEVDWAAGLLHHGLQLLILHIQLAHSGQHVPEVVLADDAISVLVDDCESLPEKEWEVKSDRSNIIIVECGAFKGFSYLKQKKID